MLGKESTQSLDTKFGYFEEPSDPVNNPAHYTHKGVEAIAAIEASMTDEEFQGYCKGNAMKYLWRYKYKGKPEYGTRTRTSISTSTSPSTSNNILWLLVNPRPTYLGGARRR